MKSYINKAACYFLFTLICHSLSAQCTLNYLVNPSFESPVQSNNNGNNFPAGTSFNGWSITNVVPANANPWNVIRVNGSGYGGGPNNAQNGLQYIDVNAAAGNIEQSFNLGCAATLTFSGYFSSREANNYANWTAQINILNSSNAVVASSSSRLFTVADADGAPDAVWYQLSGTAALAAGTYKFSAVVGNYGNFDNAFLCASPGCLLPVKLKSFEVKRDACSSQLKWTVESETDFDKYFAEYSTNGIEYNVVSVVQASGTAGNEYSVSHLPAPGKAFYRLRMKDHDGTTTYSKVISLKINCDKTTVLVYPNPVKDFLNINISMVSPRDILTAVLYDATGRLLVKKQLNNGSNTISMQKMAAGIYSLVVIQGGISTTYKISR